MQTRLAAIYGLTATNTNLVAGWKHASFLCYSMGARWFLRFPGPKLEFPRLSAYSPYLSKVSMVSPHSSRSLSKPLPHAPYQTTTMSEPHVLIHQDSRKTKNHYFLEFAPRLTKWKQTKYLENLPEFNNLKQFGSSGYQCLVQLSSVSVPSRVPVSGAAVDDAGCRVSRTRQGPARRTDAGGEERSPLPQHHDQVLEPSRTSARAVTTIRAATTKC